TRRWYRSALRSAPACASSFSSSPDARSRPTSGSCADPTCASARHAARTYRRVRRVTPAGPLEQVATDVQEGWCGGSRRNEASGEIIGRSPGARYNSPYEHAKYNRHTKHGRRGEWHETRVQDDAASQQPNDDQQIATWQEHGANSVTRRE